MIYCEHDECKTAYETDDYKRANRLKQLHFYEKNPECHRPSEKLQWGCEDCGETFDRKERWDVHEHNLARKADLDYIDYTLIERDSELGKMLLAQPRLDAIKVCMERNWAVPSLFPLLDIPLKFRQSKSAYKLWENTGNVNGIKELEQASKMQT